MPSACHGQGNQVCGPLPLHLSEAPAGDHCSGPRVFAFCVCVVRETAQKGGCRMLGFDLSRLSCRICQPKSSSHEWQKEGHSQGPGKLPRF